MKIALKNPAPNLFVSYASNDPNNVILIMVSWLLGVVGAVAILFIIIGGFQYLTSGGNPDLAKRGLSSLRNAVIGLIIVILSYIIVTVVVNSLQGI